ncbi:MAG: hypothetical protein ABH828_03020 [archaeon]
MTQLVQNIVESFRLAKNDIMKLQEEVLSLNKALKRQNEEVAKLKLSHTKLQEKVKNTKAKKPATKTKIVTIRKPVAKKVVKRVKKVYVAAKGGKKFHESNCPYAKNIKPKHKVTFKSTTKALNEGYKACNCAK